MVGEGGAKRSPTSFFPVISTNVVITPQYFLTFTFKPFVTLLKNFKFVPSASPKLLNLNQDPPPTPPPPHPHPKKKKAKSSFSGQIFLKLRL